MDELIRQLRAIGFTEMEAKIVITLTEQGMMTGYEVAKKLGVSRSNVYAALQRLVDHGYILITQGEPTYYHALNVMQMTALMNERMQEALRYVESHMPVGLQDVGGFFSVEGEKSVIETLRRNISQAQYEIIVDSAMQEASILQEELSKAELRGVKVLWSITGAEGEGEGRPTDVLKQKRLPAEFLLTGGHRFVVIIDRKLSLIGMRGDNRYAKALMSDHPAITELVLSHFVQDIVLYEMEQLLDDKLRDQVGPYYSRLVKPYLE